MSAKVILCLACLCISTVSAYSRAEVKELFENFIQKHEKQYANAQEKMVRLNIFAKNLKKVEKLNKNYVKPVYGITRFMDLTEDEFLNIYTGLNHDDHSFQNKWCQTAAVNGTDAPDAFDWRDHKVVTEVKDQRSCGSCYAFAAVGDIEGKHAIKHKELMSLSPQQIVDCDNSSYGCSGGHEKFSYRSLADMGGIEMEADYPYKAKNDKCAFDKNRVKAVVIGCESYDLKSQEKLKNLLFQKGPITVGVDGTGVALYIEGVMSDECYTGIINHSVLLVGYGTDPNDGDYWIVKNSWGSKFGENGYFRMQRGEGKTSCGIMKETIYTSVVA